MAYVPYGAEVRQILDEKGIKLTLSGNEVCYANSLMLPVKIMLCSKLHRQKGLNSIPCSCKIVFFNCLDVCHQLPDPGERWYKSRA
jgi:hypothetical protein